MAACFGSETSLCHLSPLSSEHKVKSVLAQVALLHAVLCLAHIYMYCRAKIVVCVSCTLASRHLLCVVQALFGRIMPVG